MVSPTRTNTHHTHAVMADVARGDIDGGVLSDTTPAASPLYIPPPTPDLHTNSITITPPSLHPTTLVRWLNVWRGRGLRDVDQQSVVELMKPYTPAITTYTEVVAATQASTHTPLVPPISARDAAKVADCWAVHGPAYRVPPAVYEQCDNVDLQTLRDGELISGNVISAYTNMIATRNKADASLPRIW